jgi:hypothetical protein
VLSTSNGPCTDPATSALPTNRKAKLGPGSKRDKSMKNARNYVEIRFPHHKYSPGQNVEEVDCCG